MILIFKLFVFSHLSYLSILSIRILFLVRIFFCGLVRPPSIVNNFALSCGYPSGVEVIVREFELVGIPLVRGD